MKQLVDPLFGGGIHPLPILGGWSLSQLSQGKRWGASEQQRFSDFMLKIFAN